MDTWPRSISFSKPPPTWTGAATAAIVGAGAEPDPNSTVAVADETASGDRRDPPGTHAARCSSSSTGRPPSDRPPSRARIVTSRQPILSGS
jgi:hypothetical protein